MHPRWKRLFLCVTVCAHTTPNFPKAPVLPKDLSHWFCPQNLGNHSGSDCQSQLTDRGSNLNSLGGSNSWTQTWTLTTLLLSNTKKIKTSPTLYQLGQPIKDLSEKSSFKNEFVNLDWWNLQLFCTSPTFYLSCKPPGINLEYLPPLELANILTSRSNAQVKECHLILVMKPFHCNFHFPAVEIQFTYSIFQNPKCWFFLFTLASTHFCAKRWVLALLTLYNFNRMCRPYFWTY